MTLGELITDLKAAGANENTIRLAMNCYQLGREEVVYAGSNEFVQMAIETEREACAKVCETRLGPTATDFYGNVYAQAIRARGQQ